MLTPAWLLGRELAIGPGLTAHVSSIDGARCRVRIRHSSQVWTILPMSLDDVRNLILNGAWIPC
jgi:hypothetical protein